MAATFTLRDELSPALKRAAAKMSVSARKGILEAMGEQLHTLANGSFSNTSWRAAPWAQLKASTVRQKIREGRNSGILKRTLVLSRSFRPANNNGSTIEVTSDRPYAPFNHFGAPRRGIPARPMLPFIGGPDSAQLAPFAREKIQKIAQAKIASLLKSSS